MSPANLRPFLRPQLDVLFVALNPPAQSNANGHYFSGRGSRFFLLLYKSGLTTENVPKSTADEIVFGSTAVNYRQKEFGVVDLVPDIVQTDSKRIRPTREHVEALLTQVRDVRPRYVCILHAKVRDSMMRYGRLARPLAYGTCGTPIPGSSATVVVNYFPNGNAVADDPKLRIFRELRDGL